MLVTNNDRQALQRNHRRVLARVLPAVIVMIGIWWFVSRWIEHHFGVGREVAENAVLLGVLLSAIPIGYRLRNVNSDTAVLAARQRWLQNERQDRRRARWRPLGIVLLAIILAVRLYNLVYGVYGVHSAFSLAADWDLAALAIVVVVNGRENFLWIGHTTPGDELHHTEILKAAQHGFVALLVFGFAALIYESGHPGTVSNSLPASLIASLMVTQISLAIQDRRATKETDD